MNRLLSEDEELRRLEPFAAAFLGGSWHRQISASTISRWENARTRAPMLAIRRYEELLGLAPNQLTSVIDSIYRYWDSGSDGRLVLGRQADLTSEQTQERIQSLLEEAMSSATMTGQQWDELTAYLSAGSESVLLPRRTWSIVAERLAAESMISHNLAWMQRYESLNRLLAHPMAHNAAIDACVGLAADKANPISIEPISILDGSNAAEASNHVLRQLKTPTNDRTFYGALLACVRKSRNRQFTALQTRYIVQTLHQTRSDPTFLDVAYLIAREIVTHLPAGIASEEVAFLRRLAAAGQRSNTLAHPSFAQRRISATLADIARAGMPSGFFDDMLPALAHDMLFNDSFDERLYTTMLISASPYSRPIARALVEELAGRQPLDAALTCAMIDAIRIVGDRSAAGPVARYIGRPGIDPNVSRTAAYTIGHLDREGDDRPWERLIAHSRAGWHHQHAASQLSVLKGLVYGLGIAGRTQLLVTVRDDLELPAEIRAAASWWLNLPAYVRDSAVA
ncbi:hypothetical protein [Flindersiella endophytica]